MNESIIRNAIDLSIQQNERVHVTIDGDIKSQIHDLVSATWTGEWDYSDENDGSLDVYSLNGGDSEWRLCVSEETKTND